MMRRWPEMDFGIGVSARDARPHAGERAVFDADRAGFTPIQIELDIYFDYIMPQGSKPIVVLLNGLTYDTRSWNPLVPHLRKQGFGILRFDFTGQGNTLLRHGLVDQPIRYQNQVEDLGALLRKLRIPEPVNLLGLSYGGGIGIAFAAKYPERVANLVLMAPFTEPVRKQDEWIRKQVEQYRAMAPVDNGPAIKDEELYDFFLRKCVYSTFPALEPVVLDNPYKLEACFRLTQGIRQFHARDVVARLPTRSVHLMVPLRDQYIEKKVMDDFWDGVPSRARASRLDIEDSEHKVPEAVPGLAAEWVTRILDGSGGVLQPDPVYHACSGSGAITQGMQLL